MLKSITAAIFLIVMNTSCGVADFDPFDQLQKLSPVIIAPEYPDRRTEAVPNSYIVVFRTASGTDRLNFPNYYSEYKFHYNLLAERHFSDPRVKEIQFLSAIDLAKSAQQAPSAETMLPKALTLQWGSNSLKSIVGAMARVDFTDRLGSIALLKEWEAKDIIWFAEPNWISHLSAPDPAPAATDTSFKGLTAAYTASSADWLVPMRIAQGFKFISDQIAGGTLTESALEANAPVIAVMDSGVDYDHPVLAGRMWVNENEGQADCQGDTNGCDTTVNKKGWLGDGNSVHPFGTTGAHEACPAETDEISKKVAGNCSHGTHVAGIIAGRISTADGVGAPGMCPFCKIMIVKVVSAEGSPGGGIPDSALLNGMRYVTRFLRGGTNIVRVVNASLGKFARARGVTLLVSQLLHNGSGTLLIGAAGNEDTNSRQYPAANTDALAVASVSAQPSDLGAKAKYSNYGPWVDIAAPGGTQEPGADHLINSSVPGGTLKGEQGTSMASPMVSGVAGMLLAVDPSMSAVTLRSILVATADQSIYENETNATYYYKSVEGEEAKIPLLGAGTVDLLAALTGNAQGLPIEAYLTSRVQSGCGVSGLLPIGATTSRLSVFSLLFLFWPILILAKRQVKNQPAGKSAS